MRRQNFILEQRVYYWEDGQQYEKWRQQGTVFQGSYIHGVIKIVNGIARNNNIDINDLRIKKVSRGHK